MIRDTIAAYKERLLGHSLAYNRVFAKESPYVQAVLKDLARFCRANETTYHPDPRVHAVLEGRREVWLRIQEYLNLSPDQLYNYHVAKEIHPKQEQLK